VPSNPLLVQVDGPLPVQNRA